MSFIELKTAALATASDLPQCLALRLREGRRGGAARRSMSPEMSYGRHAGPAPPTALTAAVAVLLFRRAERWHLPLTERPLTLARHAGQISLPGGAVDSAESSIQAAQRELYEELGFSAPHLVVGRLAECYVFASDFVITPWVIASFEPDTRWRPHDREVKAVVELPLDALLDERSFGQFKVERGPLEFYAPCIRVGTACIWGATSVILGELADVLHELGEQAESTANRR
jgi:8-oxo-dGTP pyrophosphatase MutT (NUDIX family)